MIKIHIIRHTHWDAEWFMTREDNKVLFEQSFSEIIKNVKDKQTPFLLDGQITVLEDYFSDLKSLEEIGKLSRENLLPIGPWVSQPDMRLSSFESLVRNYELGKKFAKSIKAKLFNIGYTPDTFGFNENIPTLYKELGIKDVALWRGVDRKKINNWPVFYWNSPGQNKVLVYNMASGYFVGRYMPSQDKELLKFYKTNIEPSIKYQTMDGKIPLMVFPVGGDQRPWNYDIELAIPKLNKINDNFKFVISTWEDFFVDMKNWIQNNPIPTYNGQMTIAYGGRLHKTISSTRQDIKKLFAELENKLTYIAEPLAMMAFKKDIEYPMLSLNQAWKLLTMSQAHDSYGGCNSDIVNKNIKNRLLRALNIVDSWIDLAKRALTQSEKTNDNLIKIYNPIDLRGKNLVEVSFATRTKNFVVINANKKVIKYILLKQQKQENGKKVIYTANEENETINPPIFINKIQFINNYKSFTNNKFYIKEVEDNLNNFIVSKKIYNEIQNDKYKIYISQDKVKIKYQNIEKDLFSIVQISDRGDSYDWSPNNSKEKEKEIDCSISNTSIFATEEFSKIVFDCKYKDFDINFEIILFRDKTSIEIRYLIKNINSQEKRFRIKFNTFTNSKNHKAFVLNSLVDRQNVIASDNWKKDGLREKPLSIDVHHGFVKIQKTKISTIHTKEYEVSKNGDNIYFTLFRNTPLLGRENLINRPGRASGLSDKKIDTPDGNLKSVVLNDVIEIDYNDSSNNLLAKKAYSSSLVYNKQNIYPHIQNMDKLQYNLPNIKSFKWNNIQVPQHLTILAMYRNNDNENVIRIGKFVSGENDKIKFWNKEYKLKIKMNQITSIILD